MEKNTKTSKSSQWYSLNRVGRVGDAEDDVEVLEHHEVAERLGLLDVGLRALEHLQALREVPGPERPVGRGADQHLFKGRVQHLIHNVRVALQREHARPLLNVPQFDYSVPPRSSNVDHLAAHARDMRDPLFVRAVVIGLQLKFAVAQLVPDPKSVRAASDQHVLFFLETGALNGVLLVQGLVALELPEVPDLNRLVLRGRHQKVVELVQVGDVLLVPGKRGNQLVAVERGVPNLYFVVQPGADQELGALLLEPLQRYH